MSGACWIGVASAEHVALGHAGGFMQVCHGKRGPLARVQPGDWIAYYSPTATFGGKDRLQTFTALGTVLPGMPYQVDMGGGFYPFRRDVQWLDAHAASIQPLLEQLEFSMGKRNWGYALRFGLVQVSAHDMQLIAAAMGVMLAARFTD